MHGMCSTVGWWYLYVGFVWCIYWQRLRAERFPASNYPTAVCVSVYHPIRNLILTPTLTLTLTLTLNVTLTLSYSTNKQR